ncbi:MAG TPA: efflux RND transporter periplasmic adaptor subunit [Candidatus Acidoferrum sp.]|nr:efflux RND transporter periplasmic adaptor subunit [Candidatus Acidoferrum sp.]
MAVSFQQSRRTKRGWIISAAGVLILAAVLIAMRYWGARGASSTVAAAGTMPTATVVRGDLVDSIELRGQFQAYNTVILEAPSDAGAIQVVKLAKDGDPIKKGDVAIVLDPSTLQSTLDQRRSDAKQTDAQKADAEAQARLTDEQDVTDLQKANYDVENAKLAASQAEILSPIDGEEKRLAVTDAEARAHQAQQKLDSDRANSRANIASFEQKRQKALRDVKYYEDAISHLTLIAPVDGIVNRLPNWRTNTGGGAQPFKEGDRAWSGASIIQLPDLSSLRISARVDETDRSRLRVGQTATARADAIPDQEFTCKVADISPLAKIDFSNGWPPAKNFDVSVQIDHPDPRLRPGMSVTERIAVQTIPNVITVPATAVFTKIGRTVAFVANGDKSSNSFSERIVVVGHRGGSLVEILSGLQPGERVALKDPSVSGKQ